MNVKEILHKINAKNTSQRKKILEILLIEKEPVTAESIYELCKDDEIDLSTIYRFLILLADNKIIDKIIREDGKSYFKIIDEEHFHNHYIKCLKCGCKTEIDFCPMEQIEYKLKDMTGYKDISHNFEFIGICPKCQKK